MATATEALSSRDGFQLNDQTGAWTQGIEGEEEMRVGFHDP